MPFLLAVLGGLRPFSACNTMVPRLFHVFYEVLGLLHKRFALMDHRLFDELALYRAAEAQDLPELRRLVALVDVDAVQAERSFPRGLVDGERFASLVALRRTPLLAAADAGHLEAVQLLLEAQAEVNYQDTAGFSALYLAAGKGVPEVVSYLLEKGAELHARNRSQGRRCESSEAPSRWLYGAAQRGGLWREMHPGAVRGGPLRGVALFGGPRGLEPQEPCGGGAGARGGGRNVS